MITPDQIIDMFEKKIQKWQDEKEKLYKPLPDDFSRFMIEKFFFPGRMVSSTKTTPEGKTYIFNANICTKTYGKIWFGDLRLEDDAEKLQEFANKLGETIYILREHDARFENEVRPKISNAVAKFSPEQGE